ncbi:C39 family peptidase [Nonomuraea sp. NPDC005983]|uniref:C39 family peptidase n=1 Tax=Nonomuraea sp. NPDC005983 TaxID=3155595 RepID=UPI0033B48B18
MKKCKTGTSIVLTVAAAVSALQFAALTPAYASPTPAAAASPAAVKSDAAAPLAYKVAVQTQYQQTNYYCVPASSSMSLSTFGVKVGQPTLAKQMKTTKSGTDGRNATPVLNAYVKSRGYAYTVVTDVNGNPAVLMNRVAQNVGGLHRAPTLAVWMERLPWNKGKVKGARVGHAVIAYGYDRLKGTITVFDPWRPTGGVHTVSAGVLAGTLQEGGGMRYISKL